MAPPFMSRLPWRPPTFAHTYHGPLQWPTLPWPTLSWPPYHGPPTMVPLPWPSPITPYYAPLPCPHTMAPPIMAHTTMIGGLGSGPAHLILLKTLTVKIVHSDAIWNDILELQIHFWKQGRACNLTLFETTRITSLKHAFWHYLKRFGTAENVFGNNVSKACILTVFKTIWNCRKHIENIGFKACALKVFETTWSCRGKNMKTMSLKHAFWWYLKQFGTTEK